MTTHRAPLEPRHATFTRVRAPQQTSAIVDTVVVTAFLSPQSYTGEDVVEISAHGSPVVLEAIVRAAIDAGARLAQPGEFTLRAFLNGKLDLVQAEAVGDLIAAVTPLQARLAFDQLEGTLTGRIAAVDADLFDVIARLEASLDFPDEGYHFIGPDEIGDSISRVMRGLEDLLANAERGRMIREGATVVIAGRPNVGKSSLFNSLAGTDRAIVTPVPGTTRDLITEQIDLDGVAVTLVDTAGAREALDIVEREGVARGEKARDVADVIVLVIDSSQPLTTDDEQLLARTAGASRIIVLNKSDCARPIVELPDGLRVSTLTGEGVDVVRRSIRTRLTGSEGLRDSAAISNMRHVVLLRDARAQLMSAATAAAERLPEELVLVDLHAARARFDEVVGRRTPDDVLQHIFDRFCIGK